MSDLEELKRFAKQLGETSEPKIIVDILRLLKKDALVNETLLRQSKIGHAVGRLRTHADKEVSDAAKDLVKKWKNEVDRQKGGSGKSTPSKTPVPQRSNSNDSKTPTTPTGASFSNTNNKGPERSAKADGVTVHVTRDKIRDKCIELLYDALSVDSDAPNDLILKRATTIEAAVYSEFNYGTGNEYKRKIRSLFLNAKDKDNSDLRSRLISGELAASELLKMSVEDMASEKRKAANDVIRAENMFKSLGAKEQEAETDAFQCGRCKQRKTRYRQAQTRSADEPMTTFVTCVSCGNRWKFS